MVEVLDALHTLGAAPGSDWDSIRQAYRDQLMAHHPDASGDDGSASQTERIVEAFRVLRSLTDDGLRPLPLPLQVDADDTDGLLVLHARPGDVFVRLLQAAEAIGQVSYADREANILMVAVGVEPESGWAPSQLTAELLADGTLTRVMFSLDPLGVLDAPPITDVVDRLAEALRAPAVLDER